MKLNMSGGTEVLQKNAENFIPLIDPKEFSFVVQKMRTFFLQKGWQEVHTQNRMSIMAACEDPNTIATYDYCGEKWPLPQTGQMWLEYELLKNPDAEGFFCVSTSYRNEPHPTPGRHYRIFPMFEFELKGGIDALRNLEVEFLTYLGFGKVKNYTFMDYESAADRFQVEILNNQHEELLAEEYGPVFFLEYFPERTSPFWNMKRNVKNKELANKIDVLLFGMETIGSAERSTNAEEQRKAFYSIENGAYAEKLFDLFGKERVVNELEDFLSFDFIPRSGGGIGITRMIRAMKLAGLMPVFQG